MDNQELLDNLQKDLNELAIQKKAHIQIEQIINHYRQKLEPKKDKK